ncbi:MAG TPA: hypothetical protein VJ762_03570 [Sphingobium sp.]|nr:hypothetical protein [Sphingobium sp.]
MIILLLALAALWAVGLYHLWPRQTRSAAVVPLHWTDRLIAIFWLPLFLPFVILALLAAAGQPRKRL